MYNVRVGQLQWLGRLITTGQVLEQFADESLTAIYSSRTPSQGTPRWARFITNLVLSNLRGEVAHAQWLLVHRDPAK